MPSAPKPSKRTKNPLSRFLPWYFGVVLALMGVGLLPGQDWVFSQFIISPIFLMGGLAGLAWTFFAVQVGRISLVSSNTGSTYVYKRRQEPVMFFLIAALYLAFCLGCTVLGLSMLFA